MNKEHVQLAQELANTIAELMQGFTDKTGLILEGKIYLREVGATETHTRANYMVGLNVVGDMAVRI